jgi:hypothetical protein
VSAPAEDRPVAVHWPDPARQAAFGRWLAQVGPRHGLDPASLEPASADASFRRYLRLRGARGSFVVMDAPPPQEDVRPFLLVGALAGAAGLHVPKVHDADPEQGFLLLDDLGCESYLDRLRSATPGEADRLMRDAIGALVRWQRHLPATSLPPFDEAAIRAELQLFSDWCVAREFGRTWSEAERIAWDGVVRQLVEHLLGQPQVAMHADWMPRNLMVSDPRPGILDFQDAVRGPIAYDIASLLRDAFLSWDEEREIDWAIRWWEQARRAGLPVAADFAEQWRAIEWTALQRHLKVLGIFCRLKHRDGKARYVEDLPRFFGYATKVALRYRELAPLLPLLEPLSGARLTAGYTF